VASKKQASRRASKRARIIKSSVLAASAVAAVAAAPAASALADGASNNAPRWAFRNNARLVPDSVVISGTVFPRDGVNPSIGQTLPYATNYGSTVPEPTPVLAQAVAPGQFPYIFNNDGPDGSFAVQTPIDLWDVSLGGQPLGAVHVPTNEMTTSFSSKSELAINLSTDGQSVSFSGYGAPVGEFDASNSNTPGSFDVTNPDLQGENSTGTAGGVYRVAGNLDSSGRWTFTETNSYSGDNERADLLNAANDTFFAAGNSNNGNSSPINPALVAGTGAQDYPESTLPESSQNPIGGTSIMPMGAFNINSLPQYSTVKDKAGKDTNFRGLTVFNNVVYYTKGSGSNGINTVYFVDTSGTACKGTGVGVPATGAVLPTPGTTYPMCVLSGFNTGRAKSLTTTPGLSTTTGGYPFGIWFANADTVYLADEGSGDNTYDPTTNTYPNADISGLAYPAGLQKYTFNGAKWVLDYTLEDGLDLGVPYTVKGYPTGDNDTYGGNGLPWAPATDGLRNIAGHVNGDGTATIYATTSTISGSGDQGADPNKVVAITDTLGATDPSTASAEQFQTIRRPVPGVRYGGVAVLPSNFGEQHGHGNQQ
jgi:hypothetical protein